MAIKTSDGFAYHVNNTGSVRDALGMGGSKGLLKLYQGTVPTNPNAAVNATDLLLTYSLNGAGTGLTLLPHATDKRTVIKDAAETWQGTVAKTGTATFYRFVRHTGDDGTLSDTQQRVQGTVGSSASDDLYLSNPVLTLGEVRALTAFAMTLPNPT
jgi:hypothetical protein